MEKRRRRRSRGGEVEKKSQRNNCFRGERGGIPLVNNIQVLFIFAQGL